MLIALWHRQGCFSAVERLGSRQWASNVEPTFPTGTQIIFRIDSRAGTADYSLAKKNNPAYAGKAKLFSNKFSMNGIINSMDSFEKGIRLFNDGCYREAHEEWEALWKTLPASPRKSFLQGLIMIATALYKYKRNEYPGMEKLMQKGINLVKSSSQDAADADPGIDIARFISAAESFWNKYLTGEVIETADLPKISSA